MNQDEFNDQLYGLLLKIKTSSKLLIDQDISEDEANKYKYLMELNLVSNLQIDYYYSGPSINAENAIITKDGFDFIEKIEQLKKPIRMNRKNRYEQLQLFLQRVEEGETDLEIPNSRVNKNDYYDLIKQAIDQELIKGIGMFYGDNEPHLVITQDARVTTAGYDVLDEPYIDPKKKQVTEQNFNFHNGDYRNSTFGSDNTQTNS